MRETNREQIRRALDECLSGMDGRPSLEKRVLARAKGERRGPRRLSLALAVALLMLLLAAAALAAGVLTGWLRLRQEDVGALHGCVSLDGTPYLSTSGGLRTWKPGRRNPRCWCPWTNYRRRVSALTRLSTRTGTHRPCWTGAERSSGAGRTARSSVRWTTRARRWTCQRNSTGRR